MSADHKIVLYDGKSGEFKTHIGTPETSHTGSVFAVSWAPDSSKFVTSSADATVRLWDAVSGDLLKTWKFEKSVANQQVGVVYAGETGIIISLSFSGELNYLSIDSVKPVKTISGHQKSITALAVTPSESVSSIYTGSYDGKVVKWNEKTGDAITVEGDGHSSLVSSLIAAGKGSSSSSQVWSTAWDDTLKLISGSKFENGHTTSLGGQPVASSIDGKYLTIVTENTLLLFDSTTGKSIGSKTLNFTAKSVAVSEKAGLIAVGRGSDNGISLFTTTPDLSPASGAALPPLRGAPSYSSFSPDGTYLAVGDFTGKIALYSVSERNVKTSRWVMHTSRITGITWHPSGDYVVTGSLDSNLYVYSVKTPGKALKSLGAHKEGVNAVAWTSTESFVSVGSDATVKHWKVKFH